MQKTSGLEGGWEEKMAGMGETHANPCPGTRGLKLSMHREVADEPRERAGLA